MLDGVHLGGKAVLPCLAGDLGGYVDMRREQTTIFAIDVQVKADWIRSFCHRLANEKSGS